MLLTEIATLTDIRCDCCKYSTGSNHPEDCFDTPETTPCKRRLEVAKLILSKILEAGDGAELPQYKAGRGVDTWIAIERIWHEKGVKDTLQAIKKLFEVEK